MSAARESFVPGTEAPTTMVGVLRARAAAEPDRVACSYLMDGEADERRLTYAALDRRARAIAAALARHAAPGARALLLHEPGLEFVAAFFGCLYAGVTAIPMQPPFAGRASAALAKVAAVVDDARPVLALTASPLREALDGVLAAAHPPARALRWLETDAVPDGMAEEWSDPAPGAGDLAFLQYTSGSTTAPRGVMLTHGALMHNSAEIERCFGHSPATTAVIWLPPYHDMGLIGGIVQPVFAGFPVTLMSPVAFLQRPLRWLQAIARTGAHTSGGPNFAYELCLRRIAPEQRASLDLSGWKLAFNGAEPINAGTLERFAEFFAPCGFRPESFYPCYGLAEATLIVAGGQKDAVPTVRRFDAAELERGRVLEAGEAPARALVGCGRSIAGQTLRIVHPETREPCAPDEIGEIWVSGPSVAPGYLGRDGDGADGCFGARLADGGGPYLRTGDLGFFHQGELFVTGRLKDLVIIAGRNHHPHDLERTVEQSHPAVRPSCSAAFAVEVGGQERLVVAAELERRALPDHRAGPWDGGVEIVRAIRRAVAERHDVPVHAVVLVRTGGIPKTSSGKVQRYLCRSGFLARTLDVLDEDVVGGSA